MCSNYRGSTLLSLYMKVFVRVLDWTVRLSAEPQIQEYQGSVRRGTPDQLFIPQVCIDVS